MRESLSFSTLLIILLKSRCTIRRGAEYTRIVVKPPSDLNQYSVKS